MDSVVSLRCPRWSGLLRWFVDLFGLDERGEPMPVKFHRSTVLGGCVTTFARWPSDARRRVGRASVPRDVVAIVPRMACDRAKAVHWAARQLVSRPVSLFGATRGRLEEELRSNVESRLLARKAGVEAC